jgi:cell division septum initiation protein DivIVA
MKNRLTTDEILDSIEFELAQGAISRDDLGAALNAVKEFQNKTRSELFGSARAAADSRAMINRQFKINDMHLTLLQEITSGLHALQSDMRHMGQLVQLRLATLPTASAIPNAAADTEAQSTYRDSLSFDAGLQAYEPEELPATPIENTLKPDTLRIKPDIRYSAVPVLGRWIWRARSAVHNLVLYYLNQLAQRQANVNQVYADRLLRLGSLIEAQQQELDSLNAQVHALQARLASTTQANSSDQL